MRNAIALVLIARNEERCIARCLASARAHVDEMIVLDTGSTDATREIAARCGARVLSAAWPDDFSAARNLDLARVGEALTVRARSPRRWPSGPTCAPCSRRAAGRARTTRGREGARTTPTRRPNCASA